MGPTTSMRWRWRRRSRLCWILPCGRRIDLPPPINLRLDHPKRPARLDLLRARILPRPRAGDLDDLAEGVAVLGGTGQGDAELAAGGGGLQRQGDVAEALGSHPLVDDLAVQGDAQ